MKYIYFISQLHHVIRGVGVVLGWMRGHLALPPRPQLVLQVLLLVQLFLVEHDSPSVPSAVLQLLLQLILQWRWASPLMDRGNCLTALLMIFLLLPRQSRTTLKASAVTSVIQGMTSGNQKILHYQSNFDFFFFYTERYRYKIHMNWLIRSRRSKSPLSFLGSLTRRSLACPTGIFLPPLCSCTTSSPFLLQFLQLSWWAPSFWFGEGRHPSAGDWLSQLANKSKVSSLLRWFMIYYFLLRRLFRAKNVFNIIMKEW